MRLRLRGGLQRLDQPARRARPGGRRHPAPALTRRSAAREGRLDRQVGAQGQGVDEEADQAFDFGPSPVGRPGCRSRRSSWPRIAAIEQGPKAASRVMNRVTPCRWLKALSCALRSASSRTASSGAGIVLQRRPRPVGRAVPAGQARPQALLPVGRLGVQQLAFGPAPLPDGIVGVLDGQGRQGIVSAATVRRRTGGPVRRSARPWTSRRR